MYRLKKFIVRRIKSNVESALLINGATSTYQIFPNRNAVATCLNGNVHTCHIFYESDNLRQILKVDLIEPTALRCTSSSYSEDGTKMSSHKTEISDSLWRWCWLYDGTLVALRTRGHIKNRSRVRDLISLNAERYAT